MAKLAFLVDCHGSDVSNIVDDINSRKGIDAILVGGDMMGHDLPPLSLAKPLVDLAKNTNKPVYSIAGSHDLYIEVYLPLMMELIEYGIIDLSHGEPEEIPKTGLVIVPYSGSDCAPGTVLGYQQIITPESDVKKLGELIKEPEKCVLLMHIPPKGYGDMAHFFLNTVTKGRGSIRFIDEYKQSVAAFMYQVEGMDMQKAIAYAERVVVERKESVGNQSLADLIEAKHPAATLFGHIHEDPRAQEVGTKRILKNKEFVDSLTLNPGPAMEGRYGIINIDAINKKASSEIIILE